MDYVNATEKRKRKIITIVFSSYSYTIHNEHWIGARAWHIASKHHTTILVCESMVNCMRKKYKKNYHTRKIIKYQMQ